VLFSKDIVFIHIPKTGGTSVSRFLGEVLPKPVYYTTDKDIALPEGVVRVPRNLHLTMRQMADVVAEYGFDIHRFPLVLAVIRSPYEMAVSWYGHYQVDTPSRQGWRQDLAMSADFETFVTAQYSRRENLHFERYLQLEGEFPHNLRVVRYENLVEGVKYELARIGIQSDAEFPWLNPSDHRPVSLYYTPAAEEAVYRLYRWVFEQGYYPRLDAESLRELPDAAPSHASKDAVLGTLRRRAERTRAQREYNQMCVSISDVVSRVVPEGATVLVVSKGDDSLLQFGARSGQHFPQNEAGEYAGYHPTSGAEAVSELERLQVRGAGYLVIPEPFFWWLESYPELAAYLQGHAGPLWSDGHCLIYALAASSAQPESPALTERM
jgi:hypothetical protein